MVLEKAIFFVDVLHCIKHRKFTEFRAVEILWKSTISAPKAMQKLCFSTKFWHQKTSWNDSNLRSASFSWKRFYLAEAIFSFVHMLV